MHVSQTEDRNQSFESEILFPLAPPGPFLFLSLSPCHTGTAAWLIKSPQKNNLLSEYLGESRVEETSC